MREGPSCHMRAPRRRAGEGDRVDRFPSVTEWSLGFSHLPFTVCLVLMARGPICLHS